MTSQPTFWTVETSRADSRRCLAIDAVVSRGAGEAHLIQGGVSEGSIATRHRLAGAFRAVGAHGALIACHSICRGAGGGIATAVIPDGDIQ